MQNEFCLTLDPEIYIETVKEKFSMQDINCSKIAAENNLELVKTIGDEHLFGATFAEAWQVLYFRWQSKPGRT